MLQRSPDRAIPMQASPTDVACPRRPSLTFVCVNEKGKVQREKKVGYKRWSKYNEDADSIRNLSVVGRAGVRSTKRMRREEPCAEPVDKVPRWVGIRPEPADLPRGQYTQLFQSGDDLYAVEAIVGERTVRGKKEYKIRWSGFDATHDSWEPEENFSVGLLPSIRHWRERNERKEEEQSLRASRARAETQRQRKPRRDVKVGDIVALLAPAAAQQPFYVGKVISDHDGEVTVHWFDEQNGNWTLQFERNKKPYLGRVYKESVVTALESIKGNRGRLAPEEHRMVLRMVELARKEQRV